MTSRAVYGSGSCEQVGPDRWRLRWSAGVDPFTGKHQRRTETITAKTAKEARKELAARTSQRRAHARVTLGDLLDITLTQLPGTTEYTRRIYGYNLAHIPPAARKWIAADISVMDGRTLFDGLTERHGAQTVRKIHGALMSCWRQARLNGWVGDLNPWRGQRLPKVPTSAGKVIGDDEIAELRTHYADLLERVWLELHFDMGARPGEICGIRWSAIDLDQLLVTVLDTKHDGGTPRTVAITPTMAAWIREWQQAQRVRAMSSKGTSLDPDPFLISGRISSDRPWTVNYAGQRWRALRGRAGIRDTLRLYDTRHTHNSWLAAAGIDEATRGQRVGNSPETNLRIYSHSTRDREAAAAIEARRGSS